MFYSKVVGVTNPDQKVKKKPLVEDVVEEIGNVKEATVFGMTCDGLDIIANNFYVP